MEDPAGATSVTKADSGLVTSPSALVPYGGFVSRGLHSGREVDHWQEVEAGKSISRLPSPRSSMAGEARKDRNRQRCHSHQHLQNKPPGAGDLDAVIIADVPEGPPGEFGAGGPVKEREVACGPGLGHCGYRSPPPDQAYGPAAMSVHGMQTRNKTGSSKEPISFCAQAPPAFRVRRIKSAYRPGNRSPRHGHCSPSARDRNVAIWARVSGASGQNWPPPQPPVTPAFARASTYWKKGCVVGTSE